MHTLGQARITFVCLKTLNGPRIQRRCTRVTSWEQSIRHMDRFWMASRTTMCRVPSARQTAPMSSWFPRDRNVMKGGVGNTTGFLWRDMNLIRRPRSLCVWTESRNSFRAHYKVLMARSFIFKRLYVDLCRACPISGAEYLPVSSVRQPCNNLLTLGDSWVW